MRRMLKVLGLFSILAVLNIATVAVFLSAIPVRAGLQQPAPACLQGDINGDGSRTLADALKLLNFLFQEGEEPVACAAGEKVDVAAEVEKALGRFLPRAEDYVYLSKTVTLDVDDEFATMLEEVPEGRAFFLVNGVSTTNVAMRVYNDKKEGRSFWPSNSAGLNNKFPRHILLPGDSIEIRHSGGSNPPTATGQIWGYWLDHEEPEK